MKLLLTNDDGIDAPGLLALEEAVAAIAQPLVVAPRRALSGCSHQVTTDEPLVLSEVAAGRNSVQGTPADCVRLGLLHLAPDSDWVLSGINNGGNLGVDTLMSGTVSAAREAALLGKRAIAFSQYRRRGQPFEWHRTTRWVASLLPQLLRRPLPPRSFWNVNLPHPAEESGSPPEIVFCPVDPHPLPVRYELIDGGFHYRSDYHARRRKPGSDVDVCFSGRVAVSLMTLD